MKPISTYAQVAALAACLAAQFHPAAGTGMPGTRKALQTMEIFTNPVNDAGTGRKTVSAASE